MVSIPGSGKYKPLWPLKGGNDFQLLSMSFAKVSSLIHEIAPVKVIMEQIRLLDRWPNIDVQEKLVPLCLNSVYQRHFPAPKKWFRTLLKAIDADINDKIIQQEKNNLNDEDIFYLSDSIAEILVNSYTCRNTETEEDYGYATYFHSAASDEIYDTKSHNSIVESTTLCLAHGAFNKVGVKVWEAGI